MSFSVDEQRTLILGASGQVGTAFRSVLPGATFLTRTDLDLSQPEMIEPALRGHVPSAVINCAAYTDVDGAESDEALAMAVNGRAVGELARVCADLGVPLVTYSTDYVFDSSKSSGYVESDAPNPISAYGRSKLDGERRAFTAGGHVLVIRTSWVISGTHDNFVATMLRLASDGVPLRVVDDQRGRPAIADDVAAGTVHALQAGAKGVLHMANRGEATWYELATSAIELAGIRGASIEPCATEDFPRPAARPANSILDSERLAGFALDELPVWRTRLPDLVRAQIERLQLSP